MNRNDLNNFVNIKGSSPTKSFSAYGVDSAFLNQNNNNYSNRYKANTMSEIDMAIQKAQEYHDRQNKLKDPVLKSKKEGILDGFSKLGSEESQNKLNSIHQNKKIQEKTNEEIQQSIEKAAEINKKFANVFDQSTPTNEILSSIIDGLF